MSNIKSLIDKALTLQNEKKLEAAHELFKTVLRADPKNIDALHGLALNLAIRKHFKESIPFFLKAIQCAPLIPAFHNNLANTYKSIGDLTEAQKHYNQALSLKPNYPEAHNNLGNLLVQQGEIIAAVQHFQKALRINPDAIDAHYNLANCYLRLDRLLEAVPHYEATLRAWPNHIGAHHNLGITLTALKQFEQAKGHLEIVVNQEPDNVDALFHFGIVCGSLHLLERSRALYETILILKPQHAEAHHNLATILLQLKDTKSALKHFEKAYQLMPENLTAAHMIKALKADPDLQAAHPAYVQALFDQYAYSYDKHVKEGLNFQVPCLLREAIAPFAADKQTPWSVLDLGCGTGLIAPYFNDIADKLYGVDLSSNMIDLAKQRGGYLELYQDDILSFLKKSNEKYDLILASDVFVYFGDLTEIFELCYKNLKSNGYFCFSIETLSDSTEPFKVRPSGRFAHTTTYIKSLLNTQLNLKYSQDAHIREQEGEPMKGTIFIFQKN
ncbi:MAG: tetratricopeptide repeat protein [Gammaproteobacteria bacterium]